MNHPAFIHLPRRLAAFAAAATLMLMVAPNLSAQSRVGPNALGGADRPLPPEVQAISSNGIRQRIGAALPLDTPLLDENGKPVKLGDYFGNDKPVLIEFAYFSCPLLCPMVENGVVQAIRQSGWIPGEQFNVLTISISPHDRPQEAIERQDSLVKRLGGSDSELGAGVRNGWHLLSGRPVDIKTIADAAGFGYTDIAAEPGQYAHAAVIMFASPKGILTRYLPGHQYSDKDFKMALVEASEGKQGSLFDMVLQLCYQFDGSTGKYTADAMALMKFAGATTVVTLGAIIGGMFFFERKRNQRLAAEDAPPLA
ncbi:MAG: SCO family protein [Algisphaera sp.]